MLRLGMSIGVIVFVLIGCGSRVSNKNLAVFSNATEGLSQKVDEVFAEYNDIVLERKYHGVADAYNNSLVEQLTLDDLLKIKKPISIEDQKNFAIYKANGYLKNYANALRLILNSNTSSEMDVSVAKLYASVNGLSKEYETLTQQELFEKEKLSFISSLVATFAQEYVEAKKQKAIKKIMIETDPWISKICDEIVLQLNKSKIEVGLIESRKEILDLKLLAFKHKVKKGKTTLAYRVEQLKKLHAQHLELLHSKLLVQQSIKAIELIKQSHHAVVEMMIQKQSTNDTVVRLIAQLKDMQDHYKDFDQMLLECEKITQNKEGVLSCDKNQ
jgi:hypothetical protein